MKILSRPFLLLALFFIAVGDGVFLALTFFRSLLIFFWHIVLHLAHNLTSFLLNGTIRREAFPRSRRKRVPVSLSVKIRYFSIGVVFCFLFIGVPLALITLLSLLPSPKNLQPNALPQTTKIFD
ncbi:MAG TPA: hypothetical protein VEW42_06485, partial [Candidatus Eisenbacteria bacterium]|nr:hypothetical protein [Candidatus Eisenbacteria bacterium]